jgi:exosome complex RNA-binding protein Csl4
MSLTCTATGDIIGTTSTHESGEGTYVRDQNIHSALTGFVRVVESGGKTTVEVYRANFKPSVVPVPGNQVICKVSHPAFVPNVR